MTCPQCGSASGQTANFCVRCGFALGGVLKTGPEPHPAGNTRAVAASGSPARPEAPVAMSRSTFACPSCGSENSQKLSILYDAGRSSTETTGIGVSTRGVAVGGARSESSSGLAEHVIPPLTALGRVIQFAIQLGTFLGIGGCVGAVYYFDFDYKNAAFAWPLWLWLILPGVFVLLLLVWLPDAIRAQREWRRSYMCLRCGQRFVGE